MKRWSSLQRELYMLIDERADFQIHLSRYRMDSQHGSTDLPRYWITVGGEIVFDYPKDFTDSENRGNAVKDLNGRVSYYPYETDISDISRFIREYIDTPKDELFSKRFESDCWGLADIFRAADKRIGKRRLEQFGQSTHSKAALRIIEQRLANYEEEHK